MKVLVSAPRAIPPMSDPAIHTTAQQRQNNPPLTQLAYRTVRPFPAGGGQDGPTPEITGVSITAAGVSLALPEGTTYDIEFSNARVENGKKVKKAKLTLKHNGVVVHQHGFNFFQFNPQSP